MTVAVGVVGVGAMGRHHARIYAENPATELVGVVDQDTERAQEIATKRNTRVLSFDELLDAADAVSVATPTAYHAQIAWEALGAGVHVLVEKPFVDDPDQGRQLVERARTNDLVLQVGHVERFNPAVEVLRDVVAETDIVALDAQRVGPPLNRAIDNSVVLDLMIHDIDIALSLVDSETGSITAVRADSYPHVTANLTFESGTVATMTAGRASQRRVRTLSVTTPESVVEVDYLRRSIEVYRQSLPEYVETDGEVRYRNESVVERPVVENGEPLKAELAAFVEAIESGTEPIVTGEDGLRALAVARSIEESATDEETVVTSL
ncbi:Gfo/Idh/MocA family oxidoreductase [Halomicroarcula sp. GCM10025709]|uniref:Gfo/Idh/MocA family oxidoreductase n=1 Tax=Haloarcula TaxID=2237 RepID=UPI0024C3CE97|nr:Gfo/Idh/MocA family oxidoreductase [Halomicroarcula sp. YJ-61-S]